MSQCRISYALTDGMIGQALMWKQPMLEMLFLNPTQCLLTHQHEGRHAAVLREVEPTGDLWLTWSDRDEVKFVVLNPCDSLDQNEDACMLYDKHPLPHTWEWVEEAS